MAGGEQMKYAGENCVRKCLTVTMRETMLPALNAYSTYSYPLNTDSYQEQDKAHSMHIRDHATRHQITNISHGNPYIKCMIKVRQWNVSLKNTHLSSGL